MVAIDVTFVHAPALQRQSQEAGIVRRVYALSGTAFVVIAVAGVVVLSGNTPDSNASTAKVVSYYDAHAGKQVAAAFFLAASVPFLVLFALHLRSAVTDGRGASEIWGRLLTLGSAVAAAVLLLTALIHFALADGVDNGLRGDGARALNVLDGDSWVAWNASLGVMMLGAAGLVLTSARLARWLGWLALLVGVFLFIPYADFFALLVTLLWILGVSVYLYARPRLTEAAAAASPVT
jgi:hypothetical protein